MRKIALVFLMACGGGSQQGTAKVDNTEFAEAAPDVSALTLDATSADATAGREVALPPSIAGNVKDAVTQINDSLRAVLANVDSMIQSAPTAASGDTRTWVAAKNGLTFKLGVSKGGVGFKWKMEAKKEAAADSDYKVVMGGRIKRQGDARRGAGFIGIDLTAFRTVAEGTAAAITKDGKLFGAFAHGNGGAHLVYRLKDYKADVSASTPAQSAYFSGFRLFKKGELPAMSFIRAGGRFNVKDFADTAGPENEVVTARLRRVIGRGGWGRAIIRQGNLPADTKRIVRECWNSPLTGTESIYVREVWDCQPSGCTRNTAVSFPADATLATEPDGQAIKARFLAQCFPDQARALASLASNEEAPPEDPAQEDAADEEPVQADQTQASVEAVLAGDANEVDSATSVTAD